MGKAIAAVIGIFALVVVIMVLATIPFWFLWTYLGYGEMYFSFLPKVWQSIPFWHCLGLMLIFGMIRAIVLPVNLKTKTK